MKMRNLLIVSLSLLLIGMMSSCAPKDEEQPVHLQGAAQGTYYSMLYFDPQHRNLTQEVDSILNAFNKSVSLWDSTSIISGVNRNDPNVVLDSNFIGNFNYSQQVSDSTDGAFDATVGPLSEVWGFEFKNIEDVTPHMVDSILPFVGYKKIKIVNGKVVKQDPRMQLDFNGIAQGYSDMVVGKFFDSKGIHNYLIDIGGEVLGKGQKPNGDPWNVGIEKPAPNADAPRTLKAVVALRNMSLATSGNYRKYYVVDGKRYGHTLDPHTGYPIQHRLLSVSVLTKNTALADAYATAFMEMGYEKSRKFVESHPSLDAFFIWIDKEGRFRTYATAGVKKIIIKDFN
ncbi:MAG: FAD:protein FMN transferase [Bacteroidales bacterium]|nr:FAD:protein FMN transferase [Bacteroidales bacterium]